LKDKIVGFWYYGRKYQVSTESGVDKTVDDHFLEKFLFGCNQVWCRASLQELGYSEQDRTKRDKIKKQQTATGTDDDDDEHFVPYNF